MPSALATPARDTPAPPPAQVVPPLLPVLVPLVIVAIVSGVVLAWLFPPPPPGAAAPAARFVDVTAEAGLDFVQRSGTGPVDETLTTLGGGAIWFDFDRDGDDDLFFTNGAPWPWEETMEMVQRRNLPALFRNNGDGHFSDVTRNAELDVELQGMTAAAGDYDNDGWPDLFVTCVGVNHLYRNRGHGEFEDVTDRAGVGGEENTWSTGAAWIDFDNDGRLDLVVGHYARWPREVGLSTAFGVAAMGHSYGTPVGFFGVLPSLYRNLGDGRFAPVPGAAGLVDIDRQTGAPTAKTLAVVPLDANADGWLDLLFSYHTSPPALFLNDGRAGFRRWSGAVENRREGLSAGLALSSPLTFARATAADIRFAALHAAATPGLHPPGDGFVPLGGKLGVALLDYDLDGRADLFSGNGHAEPDLNRFDGGRDFAAPPVLLWNRGGEWLPAPPAPGGEAGAWAAPLRARAIASSDFDGDGDTDVLIGQQGGPPRLLRNDQRLGVPWLQVELVAVRGVREAYGARVEVHTPRRVFVQSHFPAMGLFAQSSCTLTFGLGDDARVRRIVVLWPDGSRQEVPAPGINRRIVIVQE